MRHEYLAERVSYYCELVGKYRFEIENGTVMTRVRGVDGLIPTEWTKFVVAIDT